jgi:hypothetical protein
MTFNMKLTFPTVKAGGKGLGNELIPWAHVHLRLSQYHRLGLNIANVTYHGKAGLFHVSAIYAKSNFAFGLMYPLQRNVTFSGRFWQAPLNGCYILSEPGLYTQLIPGVIETDYSISDITEKTKLSFDREALQKESQEFWIKQNSITSEYVLTTLVNVKSDFYFKKTLAYSYLSMINKLRVTYLTTTLYVIWTS